MNPELTIAIEQGGNSCDPVKADVVIASIQSLSKLGQSALSDEEFVRLSKYDDGLFRAILIDEVHHSTSLSYLRVLG